jgi:hypothetical protein
MKAVGSTDQVDVVAQFDQMGDSVTRRYHLTRGGEVAADVVAELPETNTGEPTTLIDFVRWGMAEYPSERTALVLWNHGAGWKDDDVYALAREVGLTEADLPRSLVRGVSRRRIGRSLFATSVKAVLRYPAAVRAILFDDTSKDFLDNQELKAVLDAVLLARGGRKLDLLGFDACLMNMIEVAYQVQGGCVCMVGSQEIEPGEGWPYDRILAALARQPDAPPERLGQIVVDEYAGYYAQHPPNMAVTQAALRLERVPALVERVGHLADGLSARLADRAFYRQVLMPALRQVQKFRDDQYADLGHLAQLLAAQAPDEVREAAREVAARLDPSAVDSAVVRVSGPTTGFLSAGGTAAHGVSIYVPLIGRVSPAYDALAFARDGRWGPFLHAFMAS